MMAQPSGPIPAKSLGLPVQKEPKGHVQGYVTKREGRRRALSTDKLLARAYSVLALRPPEVLCRMALRVPSPALAAHVSPSPHPPQDAGPSQAWASPCSSGDSQSSEQGLADETRGSRRG